MESQDDPAPSAAVALQPGLVFGQYELIRELGRGGMGAVYLARDTRLGRRVAMKFLTQDDPALAARFLAEARTTARCRHENIVVIYGAGESQGHSYMVLEYVEGSTLRQWLDRRSQPGSDRVSTDEIPALRPVPPSMAIELITPVVRALVHAHEQGLVHRDLKPDNIILSNTGTIKVVDFGIAKPVDEAMARLSNPELQQTSLRRGFDTQVGSLVGTPSYMSPEQWGVDEVDGRSDIWAVGILLWELCSGRHPLEPKSLEQLLAIRALDRPMPSMVQEHPHVGTLAEIIDRCLRKRKADRYPSASALLAALELLARGRRPGAAESADEMETPYVGLAAFQESDADRFFGRARDVASVVVRLRHHRMVTIAGAPGAGKSSLVRAGVIPALLRSEQRWEAFTIRPGREPLNALVGVLAQLEPGSNPFADKGADEVRISALVSMLGARPGYLGAKLRTHSRQRRTRVLLFVDQFEELFTLCPDQDAREAFVRTLEGVADDPSSPLRVIISLRSDFLDRVAEERSYTREITRSLMFLAAPGRAELSEALTRPLQDIGYHFENQPILDDILDTLETFRAPLPLLQFAGAWLWDTRDRERNCVSQDSYDAMGGVTGALANHADAILASLSSRERRLARVVFTHLVTPERTRAIVDMDDMRALIPESEELASILDRLADARLLHVETASEGGEATVELCHESLITSWARLVRWLDDDASESQFRTRLRSAARDWDRMGRTDDLLWRGRAAQDARCWLDRWRVRESREGAHESGCLTGMDERDRSYLWAVVQLAERSIRRRRCAIATSLGFLGVILVIVSTLAILAIRQAQRADIHATQADEHAERAEREARRARAESVDRSARVWNADGKEHQLIRELVGHTGRVSAGSPGGVGVFGEDWRRLVTASADKSIRIWNLDDPDDPLIEPFSGLDDPRLWRATSYCPSAALRMEFLAVPAHTADQDLENCRRRVEHAR